MIGTIKSFETLKGCGIIATLKDGELPIQSRNVHMDGWVTLHKNDVVEYDLGTDENGNKEAVNVHLISKTDYKVKMSNLKFKYFGLDAKNNILNPPKCEFHNEYAMMKYSDMEELQNSICRNVCNSGKYPCGIAVLKKDNQVVIGYSDKELPSELCRFKVFGIKDASKEKQYLAVGELLTKTYQLENYGIMVELEDNFYQAIME